MRSVIGGPAAWRRADFDLDQSWIQPLDALEIAELDLALRNVLFRGLGPTEFSKVDFPLPTLSRRLKAIDQEVRVGRGFVLLRGIPVERYSLDELKTLYWGLGCHMGVILANNTAGEFVSAVVDQGELPTDPNRRNNTTNRTLEPHTDPADIVVLLCVDKAKSGGLSSLISAVTIHDELVKEHPDYLEPLYRGFQRDVRGMGASRDPNEVTPRVPVFEIHEGRLACSFSKTIIFGGAEKAGAALSSLERAAVQAVDDLAMRPDLRVDMLLEPGDIQIINNFTMLHDRTAYVDHDDGRKRYLLRMWINLPEGPQLSPDFAAVVRTGVPPRLVAQA